MTNEEIKSEMKNAVKSERKITTYILKLIMMADDRKIPLEEGYKDTFEWLVKEHKYSRSAANRRLQAARLLRAVPSAEQKIDEGAVNLTTLSQAQSMIRTQEMKSKTKVTLEEKAQVVATIENLNSFEAEQSLMNLLPENISSVKRESISVIDAETARVAVNFSNEALADLKRAKEVLAHAIPSGDAGLILARALKELLEKHDPLKKKPRRASATVSRRDTAEEGEPKNEPRKATRVEVIQEYDGKCDFTNPITGHICGERGRIERDHRIPRALDGDDSMENARVLCRAHNQYMSEKILGKERANRWRNQPRH